VIAVATITQADAYDGLVEKKTFTLPSYTTVVGNTTLKNVKIGWESYGTLNADKSNAILITHYFSGTSHEAGRYKADDPAPGYWDAIIGPGKPLDTDKYFILASDTLVNLNAKDPNCRHHRAGAHRAGNQPALWVALPDRHHPRLRQRAEGVGRVTGITRLAAVAGGLQCPH
jgi:homoserine O-acetyltransferase